MAASPRNSVNSLSLLTLDPAGTITLSPDTIPAFITIGTWLMLKNGDIFADSRRNARFASNKSEYENRRVVLLQRPSGAPEFVKVRPRSRSTHLRHKLHPHPDHDHSQAHPKCCCTEEAFVTLVPWVVDPRRCTESTYCCDEEESSPILNLRNLLRNA